MVGDEKPICLGEKEEKLRLDKELEGGGEDRDCLDKEIGGTNVGGNKEEEMALIRSWVVRGELGLTGQG